MNVYDGIMQGLQEAVDYNEGKIKARTKTISIEPVPDFEAKEIKDIRNGLGMTQVLFAGFMGVSIKTVEAWEAGRNAGRTCKANSCNASGRPEFAAEITHCCRINESMEL